MLLLLVLGVVFLVSLFLKQATQEVVSQVPLTTYEEFKAAVATAKQAFPSWKNTPITTRQRIMFKLQELIRRDIVSLLQLVCCINTFKLVRFKLGSTIRHIFRISWP